MIRKFKGLGLALVAMLALAAVAAPGAFAKEETHEFASEQALTDLTGSGSNHVFKIGSFEIKCNNAVFTGTVDKATADHVLVTPTYNNTENTCTTSIGNASVHTNGCHYTFDSDTEWHSEPAPGAYTDAKVHVVCTENKTITITGPGCTIHVGSQTPTGGVTYTNAGAGTTRDVNVKATVTGITATGTHSFGCTIAGLSGHLTNGTYTGDTTVKGYKDPSEHKVTDHVGIEVSHTEIHP